jgi:hypothetical protein
VNARIPDDALNAAFAAGRSCPLSYRYTPSSLADLSTESVDVLYCVGGLYGNTFALDALERLLEREKRGNTRVVFNGDFHWFDATANAFADVERQTLSDSRYTRLRGNVETEIASDDDIGCGCAYPDAVDDGVVERSNEILRVLRAATLSHQTLRDALAALPMTAAYNVAHQRVVVVHGDLESLAGWQLDPKSLDNLHEKPDLEQAMSDAVANIVASSHTCLPTLRTFVHERAKRTVINNGSAGMPCFANTRFGIATRIANTPASSVGLNALYGTQQNDVWIQALAIDFDFAAWRSHFLRIWPDGSAANRSYFSRIENGVEFDIEQALGALTLLAPQ